MKKFLSLVLSLVMVMSLVTINAGAKDFTDDESITYQEAIDVISTIGVVDGYSDGSFKPTDNLTRGAAAKIICNLVLGPTTAGALTVGVAPFPDVPATHTFAGNIAYCANQGIINGYKDGTFKPGDPLTGNAFMKMLLGALGYKSESEGYTGANWTVNVAKDALGIGLAKDLEGDFNGTKTVTREEACLYAFNTLSATMVEYSSNVTANLGTIGTISMNSPATNVRWSTVGITNDGNIRQDGFVQFAEKYFEKLVKSRTSDDFERPAYTWTWDKNVEIGTYVDDSLLLTDAYTEEVKGGTIYDLIGSTTLEDYELRVYVDGVLWASESADKVKTGDDKAAKDTNAYRLSQLHLTSAGNAMENTGNGVVTEVYLERPFLSVWDYSGSGTAAQGAKNGRITICIINTWLSQATSSYSTSDKDAALKVFYNIANGSTVSNTKTVKFEDVPAIEGIEKDEFFLVNMSGKGKANPGVLAKNVPSDFDIVEVAEPEIMEDSTVTKFSAEKKGDGSDSFKKLTTGGTEYKKSEMAFYDADVLDTYDDLLLTGITYNIYMDPYGFFIGVDIFSGTKNYVFIPGYDTSNSHIFNSNATAAAIFLDGSMETITVNRTDTNKNIESAWSRAIKAGASVNANGKTDVENYYEVWGQTGNGGVTHVNRWYTYSKTSTGVYTLKPVMNNTTGEVRMIASAVVDEANLEDYATEKYVDAEDIIKCNNVRLDGVTSLMQTNNARIGVNSLRAYGEDDSVFIVTENDNVDKWNQGDGGYAITGVRGVYTGVQSVELIVANSARWHDKDNKPFTPTNVNTAIPESVYTVYDKDHYIIGSIIVGEAKGGVDNYAYIIEAPISEEKIDDTYYWEFDCFHQGAKKTLTVKSKFASVAQVLSASEKHIVELQFDGEYVTGVRELEKNDKTFYDTVKAFHQKIDNETVYEVQVARHQPVSGKFDVAYDGELYLQGRTLYVSANQRDKGLTFTSGAKAYVRQEDPRNLGKDKKSVYDSVAEAVDRLTDLDTIAGGKQWSGIIHAALNSNGVAEWVVFDSWNTATKDDYAATTGTDAAGNPIYTDPLRDTTPITDPEIAGSIDDGLKDAGFDVTASVNGATDATDKKVPAAAGDKLTFNITFTAPEEDKYALVKDEAATSLEAGKSYIVTLTDGTNEWDLAAVECTEAGKLTVEYTLKAADLGKTITVKAISTTKEGELPPPADDDVVITNIIFDAFEKEEGTEFTPTIDTIEPADAKVTVGKVTVPAYSAADPTTHKATVKVTVTAGDGFCFADDDGTKGKTMVVDLEVTVTEKKSQDPSGELNEETGDNNTADTLMTVNGTTVNVYSAGAKVSKDDIAKMLAEKLGVETVTLGGSDPNYTFQTNDPTTGEKTNYTITNGAANSLKEVVIDGTTYKLANGMKVTGLTASALIDATAIAGTANTDYTANSGEYEAQGSPIKLKSAILVDNDVSGASAKYENASSRMVPLNDGDGIVAGTNVAVTWTKAQMNKNAKGILLVNDEEVEIVTGTGDKGETKPVAVAANSDGTFKIDFAANLYYVNVDGENAVNESSTWSDPELFDVSSSISVYTESALYVDEEGGKVTTTAGDYNTVDLSTAVDVNEDGILTLTPAVEVKNGTTGYKVYAKFENGAGADQIASSADGAAAINPDKPIYVIADNPNTTLAVQDGKHVGKWEEVRKASQFQKGVWAVTLDADTDTIEDATIAVDEVFTLTAGGGLTTPEGEAAAYTKETTKTAGPPETHALAKQEITPTCSKGGDAGTIEIKSDGSPETVTVAVSADGTKLEITRPDAAMEGNETFTVVIGMVDSDLTLKINVTIAKAA